MPDLTAFTRDTKDPGAYDYSLVGTAAGTTTISAEPCFFQGVLIPTRVASGVITIYDSVGTSLVVIGTITLGTQTFSDPQNSYIFKVATKNALTVVNSANTGAIVLYK
jgi:hypothetical protein